MGPTQTKYDGGFIISIYHDYVYEWEQVPEDYQPQPGEILGYNSSGKRARRVKNNDSDVSWCTWHPYSVQRIHDDRHAARQAKAEHMGDCSDSGCAMPDMHVPLGKKHDMAIIFDHMANGVLPGLTDVEAISHFECEIYPEIADFLNQAYGKTPPDQTPVAPVDQPITPAAPATPTDTSEVQL